MGDITAAPRECELISSNAIELATGFKNYTAVAGKTDRGRFASCSVAEDTSPEGELGLTIEVFEPSPISPDGLENTKVSTQGIDLPTDLAPGFAARRKSPKDQSVAFVYGWTPDYKRLLTINIYQGAPGRDSLADATEFFRQLKPILLDTRKTNHPE
ncbi:hypothetical protein [Nonomuraea rubra]|uniref:DUF3558 domain-containing protein n=1 Tax=Nonomuraea rubra TaxID=46180 RepID=A0A7X0NRH9_9ACTN|nr:hypothetical protein [Nonomuraea rubra]MBB6548290.1 hypothetical protein [Nonomuraea rubra]